MRDPYLRRPHTTPDHAVAIITTAGVCACILLAVAALVAQQLIR